MIDAKKTFDEIELFCVGLTSLFNNWSVLGLSYPGSIGVVEYAFSIIMVFMNEFVSNSDNSIVNKTIETGCVFADSCVKEMSKEKESKIFTQKVGLI